MNAQSDRTEGDGGRPVDRGWLAAWLLREGGEVVPRLAYYYRRVAALPHNLQRRLRRTLAVSLTGAALLLALSGPVGPPASAEPGSIGATIPVVNGEVEIIANGKCSLMEAIINARATKAGQLKADCVAGNLTGPDTVSLPANGLFVLTHPHNTQHGPTGLPVITSAMTIEGHGATITRSDADGTPKFRILDVDPGVTFTLRETTISNGTAGLGGGIYSQGTLVIENSTVSGNDAYWDGGGIFSCHGTAMSVRNSTISDNEAQYGGGGIWAGEAAITGSRVHNNAVYAWSGISKGGGIHAWDLTINSSTVKDNVAGAEYGGIGGGIAAHQLLMTDSIVSGNRALGGEEDSEYSAYGGGISMWSGSIGGSTIYGNEVTHGTDSYNLGFPVDGLGGGVSVFGDLTIANSTVSGNIANSGGGIFVWGSARLSLANTTITDNLAKEVLWSYGWEYYTVLGRGGGIALGGSNETAPSVTLHGVILSGNRADEQGQELASRWCGTYGGDCTAVVTSAGYNVFGHSGSADDIIPGPTDIVPTVGIEAILGPLADNGGPTPTHALVAGSPALDIAPSASCMADPVNGVDQRGLPRNANGVNGPGSNECDAGSFELQPAKSGAFLVSATRAGSVGGVRFTPGDILKYDPAAGWSLYFDGSDVGVSTGVSAFDVQDDGSILLSFGARQSIPGVGTYRPQDIARFAPVTLGKNTTGTFSWALDGSNYHLTLWSERIDALADTGNGRTAVSTTGTATVALPDGRLIKAQDEDALAIRLKNGRWSTFLDGTAVPGLKAEDVNALWVDAATGELYISVLDAFDLGGVTGNGKDIIKLTPSDAPGGYTPSLWWDGSANGFPTTISGLEILP